MSRPQKLRISAAVEIVHLMILSINVDENYQGRRQRTVVGAAKEFRKILTPLRG
jgi:hypothetical protein